MGFRNPITSLSADKVTSGAFSGAYTLPGLLTVGTPDAARVEIGDNGTARGVRLYAADGVTVLASLNVDAHTSMVQSAAVATTAGTAAHAGSADTATTADSADTVPAGGIQSGGIAGLLTIGNPAAAHAEIGTNTGGASGIRLYAADGVSVLVDLDAITGAGTFRGDLTCASDSGSVEVHGNQLNTGYPGAMFTRAYDGKFFGGLYVQSIIVPPGPIDQSCVVLEASSDGAINSSGATLQLSPGLVFPPYPDVPPQALITAADILLDGTPRATAAFKPLVPYTKIGLTAPWQSVSAGLGVGYLQTVDGMVHLAGRVKTAVDPGSTLAFMAAGTIPAALRPVFQRAYPVSVQQGSSSFTAGVVFVNGDGSVAMQVNPGITPGITLDHIAWTPGL